MIYVNKKLEGVKPRDVKYLSQGDAIVKSSKPSNCPQFHHIVINRQTTSFTTHQIKEKKEKKSLQIQHTHPDNLERKTVKIT